MKELSNKVAVVTGAASGIGRALANALAAEGAHLALWDVDEQALSETAEQASSRGNTRVTWARVDVSDRAAVFDAADQVLREHGQVDAVVNNAGVTVLDGLETVSFEDFEWVMAVNFWGVVYGVRAFLPHLHERPEASIVNIASVNAFLPFPHNGPYNCSKYAVYGLSETLQQELDGTSVRVTSVHPGGIDTNIVRGARFRSMGKEGVTHDDMVGSFRRIARTQPQHAAATILHGIRHEKRRVLIGADARFMDRVKRLAPQTSVRLIPRIMNSMIGNRR